MHGHEKSDRMTAAAKPTNKAVPTAAEPVERRAGAKGNASQQSTHRTQRRVRVSQALERVRQVSPRRHTPKAGAVCGNSARTDLGGGRSVMAVPTALQCEPYRFGPNLDITDRFLLRCTAPNPRQDCTWSVRLGPPTVRDRPAGFPASLRVPQVGLQ